MVLLVIDAQKGITNDKLFNFEKFTTNVKKLIQLSRTNNVEVIFVQHDDGVDSGFSIGDKDFEIYDKFRPTEDEKVFIKKVNSVFNEEIGLIQYLKEVNEKEIMIVGLQTDYCIDASVKCGFEHGFNIFIPEYTNSSFDNNYMTKEQTYHYYNEMMWCNRYAKCISMAEASTLLQMSQR